MIKKFIVFFTKPFRYAVCFSVLLILFSVYVLLNAFIIPKVYAVIDDLPEKNDIDGYGAGEHIENIAEPVITDMSYYDENIDLKIEKFNENGVVFYVADLKISDIKYLRTAFAKNKFGKNINEKTSVMAKNNNAIFAVNGDYCGFRDDGVIMRNGRLLRENPRTYGRCGLVIDENGDLLIFDERELTSDNLSTLNAVQCFSFGPTLVVDGEININETGTSKDKNPRTAIGQIGPLHYIFIVVDGRTKESNGMTFPELAEKFKRRGCISAYNLDGGGSATMWFNDKVVNFPTDGKKAREREISDIIYIGY